MIKLSNMNCIHFGNLRKAKDAYDDLYKRMTAEKGKMSVKRVAKKLMDCGVVPAAKPKQLEMILETADAGDESAEPASP